MLQIMPQLQILLCYEPIDFRLGLDRLSALCRSWGQDPHSGRVFVFRNRRGTQLKLFTYDGVGHYLSRERQNTTITESIGGKTVTIIEPRDALYGRSIKVVRSYKSKAGQRLVIELEDGRYRRISASITNLIQKEPPAPASVPASEIALISVRTILPLARLICAMVATREDQAHEATNQTTPIERNSREFELSNNSDSNSDIMELSRSQHSTSANTMPGRTNSASASRRSSSKKGTRQ